MEPSSTRKDVESVAMTTNSKIGVIALHGLGGSPESLGDVPARLEALGYRVSAPVLIGHATTPTELEGVQAHDWVRQIRHQIASAEGPVIVLGQSLGGALALIAASHEDTVAAVVCINAPVTPSDPDVVEHLSALAAASRRVPSGSTMHDPHAHDSGYDELPATALVALVEAGDEAHRVCAHITVPVLVVTSRHDDVVDPWTGNDLATRLGGEVEHLHLDRGGHVACLDLDRDTLASAIEAFIEKVSAGST